MKLRIRYENRSQTLELDAEETDELWVCLDLEGEEMTQEERETLIQRSFDDRFNRPEYNNWHRFSRHRGESKKRQGEEDDPEDLDLTMPLMEEVFDDRIFRHDEMEREEKESREAVCQWVRKNLKEKPYWAEAFIAVRINGMSVNEYAVSIGVLDASTVSHWLKRAEKKLKEEWNARSDI